MNKGCLSWRDVPTKTDMKPTGRGRSNSEITDTQVESFQNIGPIKPNTQNIEIPAKTDPIEISKNIEEHKAKMNKVRPTVNIPYKEKNSPFRDSVKSRSDANSVSQQEMGNLSRKLDDS